MVANNPKKKRNNSNQNKDELTKKDLSPELQLLQQNVGETLLTGINSDPKPTLELLKGKDLVGLYFGAAWATPCQSFTPKLVEFYNKCGKSNGMEIIYISSDNSKEEFHAELGKMPWLAIDGDEKGTHLKHALATNLKAFNIPTLVILNIHTGNFVTDLARKDLLEMYKTLEQPQEQDVKPDYDAKAKALLEQWKTMEPIAIGHNETVLTNIQNAIDFFAANPLYLLLLVCVIAFSSIVKRMIDNPLIAVAFWMIFKNCTKERLARNEPYVIQEETQKGSTSTTDIATAEAEKKDK